MKYLLPHEALLAQLGAEQGADKETWENRISVGIDTYKDYQKGIFKPELGDTVTVSYLLAIDAMRLGKTVTTPVRLDWGSSGPSLMSAVFRDVVGMKTTGCLSTFPGDLYGTLAHGVGVPVEFRKRFKGKVVLPYMYGGALGVIECLPQLLNCTPKEAWKLFSDTYEMFLPKPYEVRKAFLMSWNPSAVMYIWLCPDGHESRVWVTNKTTEHIEITLPKRKLSVSTEMDRLGCKAQKEEGTRCLGAHTVQGLDAYVLREITRRLQGHKMRALFSQMKPNTSLSSSDVTGGYHKVLKAWEETKVLSLACLEYSDTKEIPEDLYTAVGNLIETLPESNIPVMAVHDEFGVMPYHINDLRRVANRVYADIYQSELHSYWNNHFHLDVEAYATSDCVFDNILESDYLIC